MGSGEHGQLGNGRTGEHIATGSKTMFDIHSEPSKLWSIYFKIDRPYVRSTRKRPWRERNHSHFLRASAFHCNGQRWVSRFFFWWLNVITPTVPTASFMYGVTTVIVVLASEISRTFWFRRLFPRHVFKPASAIVNSRLTTEILVRRTQWSYPCKHYRCWTFQFRSCRPAKDVLDGRQGTSSRLRTWGYYWYH